jgi:heptosyltransferase I
MERILIARLGAMGDILHALPAVAALHQKHPEAKIDWLVERRWRDLLPAFINPVEVDTRKWRKALLSNETRQELRALRARGVHDIAIDLQGSSKSAALARWMKPQYLLGSTTPREWIARFLYDGMVELESSHVIEQAWELVDAASGADIPKPRRDCFDPYVSTEGSMGNRAAILNPGAGWQAKQWPARHYAELAQRLPALGLTPIVNVGPGEETLGRQVSELAGGIEVASFPLHSLIALTRVASLFVGGDTGPMHLAAMLGVPTVAIFGPTDPARNGPYYQRTAVVRSPRSYTSYSHSATHDAGIKSITVDEVMSAIEKVLA